MDDAKFGARTISGEVLVRPRISTWGALSRRKLASGRRERSGMWERPSEMRFGWSGKIAR